MRRFMTLLGVVAMVAAISSSAFAVPAAQGDDAAAASDQWDDEGEKKAKKPIGDTTRDKWHRKSAGKSDKPKSKPKYKPWDEVLKDAEKHEGLFNVYTKGEDVFFEIRQDQFDTPFINFMTLSKGIGSRFVLGGLPINGDEMFDFHRVEDHVQMRNLNQRFRAGGDDALAAAVDLSYGNSIVFNLPIASEKGKEEEKSVLIQMNKVFLSDMSDMSFWLQLVLQKPVRMDAKKGVFRKVKTFPENIEIEALLTYSPGDRRGLNLPQVPDARYIEIGVHYSLRKLPEVPMKPRLADDRVGYFLSPHKNFAKDAKDDFFVYYVNRWRLEKEDPSASMSPPKKPITFYIDPTIPEKYRPAVARGIEMWQKAYEAAGFEKGIIAKEVGDDPDYDAEDARYSTIRWIVSDQPSFGAIGPSRVDPRTGEILDADILMEQNMIAGFRRTYRRYAGPEAFLMNDPMLKALRDPATDPVLAAEQEVQRRFLGHSCDMMHGFMSNFDFLQLAVLVMGGTGMDVPEEYVDEAISFVTAHEVGHTLGLRHNFKSSAAIPYDKLNDRATIERIGMTGSVMDYPTPNVALNSADQGYYFTPSVGTYDQWAIKYGYMELSGDRTPEEEYESLVSVANEASEKENLYGTDEDTYPAHAIEPESMIWDLSDEPLTWAKERMAVCKEILANGDLVERVVREGDNYVPMRNAIQTILFQEYAAGSRAVRYIGGQYTARPHRGDGSGQKPMMPVSAAKQREAMGVLVDNIFAKDAFAVSPETLNMLMDDKFWSWQNNLFQPGRRFDFPMSGWVGAFQNAVLAQLMNPMRLQRIVDTQYKQDDPYRLSEMMRSLTGAIWYENMNPSGQTAVMQRNAQRIYLNYLTNMVVRPAPGTPSEAISLARLHLTRLDARIDRAYTQSGLSDEQNAHLLESKARIDRAIDAEVLSGF